MLIFHLGFPKTGSKFLQLFFFKKFNNSILPFSIQDLVILEKLFSNEKKEIHKTIDYILEKKKDLTIISNEDLILSVNDNIYNEKNKDKIFNSLKIINSYHKKKQGKKLKFIIGIRPQSSFLISLYSNISSSFLRASTNHFNKFVNFFLKKNFFLLDYYHCYKKLNQITDVNNIFMYEVSLLNRITIKKMNYFINSRYDNTMFDKKNYNIINRGRISKHSWKIKEIKLFSSFYKTLIKPSKRKFLYYNTIKFLKIIDKILNIFFIRNKEFEPEQKTIDEINKVFKKSNRKLINLKKKYPKNIILNYSSWEV